MKHVFGVSSHLAFYLCHHLIQTDSLNPNDCIFFTTRDYSFPAQYNSIYTNVIKTSYNLSSTQGRIFAGWKFWQTHKNIKEFDNLIDKYLNNNQFIWYTQVCFNDFCSLMVTKSNCAGYYVIEDGSGSYRKENKPTFIGIKGIIYHTILKPLFPRLYVVKNRMIETNHPKFLGCIATNEMCFPLHKQYTKVIGLPFKPTPLEITPDAIISIDPMFHWISVENSEYVFKKLAEYVNKKNYKKIAYKHHPYTLSKANKEIYEQYNIWIHKYFDSELYELNSEVSLENSLMAHKCDFFTAVSSVAIYAKAMGITCYSYMPILHKFTSLSQPVVEEICIPIK